MILPSLFRLILLLAVGRLPTEFASRKGLRAGSGVIVSAASEDHLCALGECDVCFGKARAAQGIGVHS